MIKNETNIVENDKKRLDVKGDFVYFIRLRGAIGRILGF